MNFNIPTEFYCEKNCVKNHSIDIEAFGAKALIITGRHSARINGSLDDVISVLNTIDTKYMIFDEIDENPSIENVLQAVIKSRSFSPDFVIGIGGGSPLDASKAIALLLANPEQGEDILFKPEKLSHLPVISIPTTCGTGSEVTPYAILTIHNSRTKASISHKIFPSLALADPDYLNSASHTLTVNTSIDALGHVIESYINTKSTMISRMFCEKSFTLWKQIDAMLDKEKLSDSDKEILMMNSTFAGMAIAHTGTSLPHGMSYPITYEHGIPHGKAVGIFLAGYLGYADDKDKSFILDSLGYETIEQFALRLRELLGKTTITAYEKEFSINSILENKKKLANCPYKVDESVIRGIYDHSIITS